MAIRSFAGHPLKRRPAVKAIKKPKKSAEELNQLKARAILRKTGLGLGLSGWDLIQFAEEKMREIGQHLSSQLQVQAAAY